jgi:hypothetical protein
MSEHNFSRILFLCLLTTYGFYYTQNNLWTGIFLIIDIITWILYWISHNFEKITFKLSRKKETHTKSDNIR